MKTKTRNISTCTFPHRYYYCYQQPTASSTTSSSRGEPELALLHLGVGRGLLLGDRPFFFYGTINRI